MGNGDFVAPHAQQAAAAAATAPQQQPLEHGPEGPALTAEQIVELKRLRKKQEKKAAKKAKKAAKKVGCAFRVCHALAWNKAW